jgi:hypothetical protein
MDWKVRFQCPARVRHFMLHSVQTGSEDNPTSRVGTGGSFPEDKEAKTWSWPNTLWEPSMKTSHMLELPVTCGRIPWKAPTSSPRGDWCLGCIVAIVGCHGNSVYRAVAWIPICISVTEVLSIWEVSMEGSHNPNVRQRAGIVELYLHATYVFMTS